MFFNTGFQFNYAEPFSLSSFYNATYFQNILDGRQNLGEKFSSSEIVQKNSKHEAMDDSSTQSTNDMQSTRIADRSVDSKRNSLIGSDVTAAQLYRSIEDNIKE